MPRYAALLRGVTPMNLKMPALQEAFEKAGFTDVRTVLSSGNVLFSAPKSAEFALERRAEESMERRLGRAFFTIVRPVDALRAILDADPYRGFRLAPGSKRVVTFLREAPQTKLALPIDLDGARILRLSGREVFSAYVRTPKGPVFMGLIERTLGKEATTRTWETVTKLAR
jgi:uncharacterized protein (DUF1697 family)